MKYLVTRSGAVLLAVFFLVPGAAPAQEAAADANSHPRSGFWFNGGLGYASLGCEECADREDGLSVVLGLGGTLSQNWLLGGSAHAWTKTENDVTLTTAAYVAEVRFYPSATGGFFLTGGLGFATIEAQAGGTTLSQEGGGAVLGLGYDFRLSDGVSLTPYGNGVGISTDDTDANFAEVGLSVNVH